MIKSLFANIYSRLSNPEMSHRYGYIPISVRIFKILLMAKRIVHQALYNSPGFVWLRWFQEFPTLVSFDIAVCWWLAWDLSLPTFVILWASQLGGINLLGPNDAIWRHRTYLFKVDWSSERLRDIQLREMSQEIVKISIHYMPRIPQIYPWYPQITA